MRTVMQGDAGGKVLIQKPQDVPGGLHHADQGLTVRPSAGALQQTHREAHRDEHTHNSNAPNTVWEVEASLLTRIHPTSPPCCQLAARLLCVLLIKFSSRHSWSQLSASNSAAWQQMSNRCERHSLSSEQSTHTLMQKSNQTWAFNTMITQCDSIRI